MIKNTSDQHQYLAAPTYENLSTVASKGRVANHSFSHLDFIRDRYSQTGKEVPSNKTPALTKDRKMGI